MIIYKYFQIKYLLLLCCLLLLTSCGGVKVLEVNLDDDEKEYTVRQEPAGIIEPGESLKEEAIEIGYMMVSPGDEFYDVATEKAAQLGADFISCDEYVHTIYGSSDTVYTKSEVNASGTVMYRNVNLGTKYNTTEAKKVYLYRKEPIDPEGCLGKMFPKIMGNCYDDNIDPFLIQINRGCKGSEMPPNGIPPVYELMGCIAYESTYYSIYDTVDESFERLKERLENFLYKLKILLNHGLDPNIKPSENKITTVPIGERPYVLKRINNNIPSILKIIIEQRNKSEQELTKLEDIIAKNKQEIEMLAEMTWQKAEEYIKGKEKEEKTNKIEQAKEILCMKKYYSLKIEKLKEIEQVLIQKGAKI